MIAFALGLVFVAVVAAIAYWRWLGATYGAPVRADEVHTVTTDDLWRIRLYRYKPARGKGEPVFLCHGLFGNQYNFSYPENASLVDALREKGYDCWIVELRGGRTSIAPYGRNWTEVTMDDYLAHDLPAAVDHVLRETGYAKVHWVGHSMGGMLLYAYEQAYGRGQIACGVTLGSPPGFAGAILARPNFLLQLLDLFPGQLGYIARALSPIAPLLPSFGKYAPANWHNMHPTAKPGVIYNLMDNPAPLVTRKMLDAADTNTLILKKAGGGDINFVAGLNKLETPLFALFGRIDPFVCMGTAAGFFEHLPTEDKKILVLSKDNGHAADYSHIDLVFGRDCKKDVFEPIADWLHAHAIGAKPASVSIRAAATPKPAAPKVAPPVVVAEPVMKEPIPAPVPAPMPAEEEAPAAPETPPVPEPISAMAIEEAAPVKAAKKPAAPKKKPPVAKKPVAAKKSVAKPTAPTLAAAAEMAAGKKPAAPAPKKAPAKKKAAKESPKG